jgi:hypothetical protein
LHVRELVYLHGSGNRSPRASVVVLAPWARAACHGPHTSRSRGRSCEAETFRARRRLLGGIPLVGNWSEMPPTGRRLDVLLVWILTGVLSPPRLESWPSRCQRCWVTLYLRELFSLSKGALIRALVNGTELIFPILVAAEKKTTGAIYKSVYLFPPKC